MAENQRPYIPDDRYARESFTFRRMKRWQVQALSIVAAVIMLALIASAIWTLPITALARAERLLGPDPAAVVGGGEAFSSAGVRV